MLQTSAKWMLGWGLCLFLATGLAVHAGSPGYRVRMLHVPERGLKGLLEDESEAVELRDQPPPTDALLLARGERDRPRLVEVLRSRGYYEADVAVRLSGPEGKRKLIFDIRPGPLYHIGKIQISLGELALPRLSRIGLKPGQPARADFTLQAERELMQYVRRRGHPFPAWVTRRYHLDKEAARLQVEWVVDPGPLAFFGPAAVTGLDRVSESYVRGALDWQEGDRFDPERMEDTRSALARSGLFSTLALEIPGQVEEDGTLPVSLFLKERRRRTVSATVGYKTDEGAGMGAQWEHRNLLGGAERLQLKALWAEQAQSAEVSFKKPQFAHTRQDLALSLRLADEQPEAYESRNIRAAAQLEQVWNRRWSSRYGGAVRYTRVDQLDEEDDFLLLSLPSEVTWNTSNDTLDARRGHVLRGEVEPFYDALAGDVFFLKSTLRGQKYLPLNRDRSWVAAARIAVGGIAGAEQKNLPADELFYAGGGTSIRGYAYQTVGPMEGDQPLGGQSLFESSFELRWQINRSLGLVGFIDGGTAFASSAPDFDETLRWGTGAGLRYYTALGPLRVDVGFPLDRREDIDKSYQLYVSLGQAF